MVRPAFMRPRDEAGDRRLRDNIEGCALADVPSSTSHGIEHVGAPRTGTLPLGPIHEAVEDQRVVRAEKLRHADFFGHAVLAETFKYIVLGHLAAGRQTSALRRYRFGRSEEHTSELQSLMRISYAVFRLKTKKCVD